MRIILSILLIMVLVNLSFSQSKSITLNTVDTQTIVLPANWFILSTYLQPAQPDIANVLSPINTSLIIAKSGTGQSYWPMFGVNLIGNIVPGYGYQVKLTSPDTLSITGQIIEPDTCAIMLPATWSLLGYLRTDPASVVEMLSEITNNMLIVKDWTGQSYWPQYNLNQIGSMQPGLGYQIKLLSQDTLIYMHNTSSNDPNFICGNQISDYDGNFYNTVLVGNQCWMKENLRVSHYTDGTAIPYLPLNSSWSTLNTNNTEKAYCFYNNNPVGDYGALYTWAAAMNGALSNSGNPGSVQGVCPEGWHVPTESEWDELITFLGGINSAGGQLKEPGLAHWNPPNTCGTNNSGFTALPGGYRYHMTGSFNHKGNYGYWWKATEHTGSYAKYIRLAYNVSAITNYHMKKSTGFSVRCLKD